MSMPLSTRRPGGWSRETVLIGALATALVACQSDLSTAPVNPGETLPPSSSANPLASFTFYIDQASKARQTADAWRATRPADAIQMDKIASQPMARWFGSWNSVASVRSEVASAVAASAGAGRVPVFVAYNIPLRDCGGLSGSNTLTPDDYRAWIAEFARGLGQSPAVVILEPDALAAMGCLSSGDQATRVELIRFALDQIRGNTGAKVYLDAGHARWQSPATMASRLIAAGIATAAGFTLNVSNFIGDADNLQYGTQLSSLVGGKHFIIDSGRNGLGATADLQWCNPEGRAIGRRPTTSTGNALVDAYLWIKTPGESDGACNGHPPSGTWMPEYALGLASRG
ncbi:MAG TPA: glycoside hydrolase family 6 protein [Gemmatimonadaceae bacterium]|nr:glycoside hydrolase family 6 protein [Gemmatimonadaceae bacterium]